MKKALALLLSFAMLFTVLTVNVFAAEGLPTISISGIQDVEKGDVTVNVNIDNFNNSVAGMDLVVKAADTGIVFNSISNASGIDLATDDYKLTASELHVVDLTTNVDDAVISIAATVTADTTITVEADLAKDGISLYAESEVDISETNLVTIKEVILSGTVKDEDLTDGAVTIDGNIADNYFIPYGCVYIKNQDGTYTYIDKENDATFSVEKAGVQWAKIEAPANGFGTFGISEAINTATPAIQFGTYSEKVAAEHGTLIIAGDWSALVEAQKSTMNEAAIVERLNTLYKDNIGTNDFVEVTFGVEKSVRVYKVAQYNYMWNNGSVLEYAVRVNSLVSGDDYAAVGYYDDGATHFSEKIISKNYIANS